MSEKHLWWQSGIIYQIYPRSFMDGNNDGVGDLIGIAAKLDYLKSLGVKCVWLSPIFPSPMYDFGYDVADYEDIEPLFGNMKDFDYLLEEVHKRDMKLILDLVPNHTSHEHKWFKESRKSKDNPKRDWYHWRDPAPNGGPPNNWRSMFGGSAWEFDEHTNQYYLHLFCVEQPDLNYSNPEVWQAMLNVIDFWMKKGIDGFRVDVIACMWKDLRYLDHPLNPNWDGKHPYGKYNNIYVANLPKVHEIIKDMRKVMDNYPDRVMVGETYMPYKDLIMYYGEKNDECHLPFNFHLLEAKWDAKVFKQEVDDYEAALTEGRWPNYVLGNHDQKRIATKIGAKQARVANMLLLTLRGTPTVYYGEELGMHNVKIPAHLVQDPPAVNMPEIADEVGRDPVRTPMQWNSSENAGFSKPGVKTWLPLSEDYKEFNVESELKDKASMLSLFKALSSLRSSEKALSVGDYIPVTVKVKDIFAYQRVFGTDKFLIVLNFGSKKHTVNLSAVAEKGEIEVCTDMKRNGVVTLEKLIVNPDEGLLIKL